MGERCIDIEASPGSRLSKFTNNVERYGIEQAIIYAYGLPAGGRVERHQLLIADIRSLVSASPVSPSDGAQKQPDN